MRNLYNILISLIFILQLADFSYCAPKIGDYSTLKLKYDSVLKIADSLKYTQKYYQSAPDSKEILTLVNTFYDTAWNKLLLFLSIIGAILLFLIPYFLNRLQKLELDKNVEMLKIIARETIEQSKKEILEKTDILIGKELSKSKEDIKKEILYTTAMTHYVQAKFNEDKDKKTALIGYLKSISFQLQSEKYNNLKISVERVVEIINEIGKQSIDKDLNNRLEHVLLKLDEKNGSGIFSTFIQEIRNCVI